PKARATGASEAEACHAFILDCAGLSHLDEQGQGGDFANSRNAQPAGHAAINHRGALARQNL
ncbi:MAG: hypothetical protein ACR2KT_16055, partial [Methylocella sp.]